MSVSSSFDEAVRQRPFGYKAEGSLERLLGNWPNVAMQNTDQAGVGADSILRLVRLCIKYAPNAIQCTTGTGIGPDT